MVEDTIPNGRLVRYHGSLAAYYGRTMFVAGSYLDYGDQGGTKYVLQYGSKANEIIENIRRESFTLL
jgi:hypothetical protein